MVISNLKNILLFIIMLLLNYKIGVSQSLNPAIVIAIPDRPIGSPDDPNYFCAQFTDCKYLIKPNGLTTRYSDDYSDSIKFNIEIEKDFIIEHAELFHFEKKLFIVYTETNWDEAGSTIACFDMIDFKKKWSISGMGFNLSEIVIKENFAYLSAIGSVAKIDLTNGKVAFMYNDLYDRVKEAFNSFIGTKFCGDTVYFISRNHKTGSLDKIVVNDRTNRLIEIIK